MFNCSHLPFHNILSSHNFCQLLHVCAARNKSLGGKYESTFNATSLGNRDMKSRWNCGSITFIIWRTCVGSQCSINRSTAISRSTCDHWSNWVSQSCSSGGGLSRVGITDLHVGEKMQLMKISESFDPNKNILLILSLTLAFVKCYWLRWLVCIDDYLDLRIIYMTRHFPMLFAFCPDHSF